MLFEHLPDDIFKPLAGPNARVFEDVLRMLHVFFSDEELSNEGLSPRRKLVIGEIEELLARKGRVLRADEDSEEGDADSPQRAANYVYRRLRDTGWLEEEPDGYNINVQMPPDASTLLDALMVITLGERKNYGGAVASINLQLEAIANAPNDHARAFIEVVRAARDFTRHLRNMLAGMRGFQETIARHRDPRVALTSFFDDFVENLLISDYKTLQSEDNPFRHRANVIRNLVMIEHSPACREALAKVYAEDKNLSSAKAADVVQHDIRVVQRIFESVDRRLAAIDSYRSRLESRVAEMVRYLDRSVPEITTRSLDLIRRLAAMETEETPATRCVQVKLLSLKSLHKRKKRRVPAPVDIPEKAEVSEEAKKLREARMTYLRRRRMSPEGVRKYLEAQMDGKDRVTAGELRIETVEDAVAFTFIPLMTRHKGVLKKFEVRLTGETLENDWLEGPDFVIAKK